MDTSSKIRKPYFEDGVEQLKNEQGSSIKNEDNIVSYKDTSSDVLIEVETPLSDKPSEKNTKEILPYNARVVMAELVSIEKNIGQPAANTSAKDGSDAESVNILIRQKPRPKKETRDAPELFNTVLYLKNDMSSEHDEAAKEKTRKHGELIPETGTLLYPLNTLSVTEMDHLDASLEEDGLKNRKKAHLDNHVEENCESVTPSTALKNTQVTAQASGQHENSDDVLPGVLSNEPRSILYGSVEFPAPFRLSKSTIKKTETLSGSKDESNIAFTDIVPPIVIIPKKPSITKHTNEIQDGSSSKHTLVTMERLNQEEEAVKISIEPTGGMTTKENDRSTTADDNLALTKDSHLSESSEVISDSNSKEVTKTACSIQGTMASTENSTVKVTKQIAEKNTDTGKGETVASLLGPNKNKSSDVSDTSEEFYTTMLYPNYGFLSVQDPAPSSNAEKETEKHEDLNPDVSATDDSKIESDPTIENLAVFSSLGKENGRVEEIRSDDLTKKPSDKSAPIKTRKDTQITSQTSVNDESSNNALPGALSSENQTSVSDFSEFPATLRSSRYLIENFKTLSSQKDEYSEAFTENLPPIVIKSRKPSITQHRSEFQNGLSSEHTFLTTEKFSNEKDTKIMTGFTEGNADKTVEEHEEATSSNENIVSTQNDHTFKSSDPKGLTSGSSSEEFRITNWKQATYSVQEIADGSKDKKPLAEAHTNKTETSSVDASKNNPADVSGATEALSTVSQPNHNIRDVQETTTSAERLKAKPKTENNTGTKTPLTDKNQENPTGTLETAGEEFYTVLYPQYGVFNVQETTPIVNKTNTENLNTVTLSTENKPQPTIIEHTEFPLVYFPVKNDSKKSSVADSSVVEENLVTFVEPKTYTLVYPKKSEFADKTYAFHEEAASMSNFVTFDPAKPMDVSKPIVLSGEVGHSSAASLVIENGTATLPPLSGHVGKLSSPVSTDTHQILSGCATEVPESLTAPVITLGQVFDSATQTGKILEKPSNSEEIIMHHHTEAPFVVTMAGVTSHKPTIKSNSASDSAKGSSEAGEKKASSSESSDPTTTHYSSKPTHLTKPSAPTHKPPAIPVTTGTIISSAHTAVKKMLPPVSSTILHSAPIHSENSVIIFPEPPKPVMPTRHPPSRPSSYLNTGLELMIHPRDPVLFNSDICQQLLKQLFINPIKTLQSMDPQCMNDPQIIAFLDETKVSYLTPNAFKKVTLESLRLFKFKMTPDFFAALPTHTIASLTMNDLNLQNDDILSRFSSTQLESIQWEVWIALSKEQRESIRDEARAGLSSIRQEIFAKFASSSANRNSVSLLVPFFLFFLLL